MHGLFLGLANGATCLAFCAPVLVPYLMHQGTGVRQNLWTLLMFLGGRLGGYTLFALVAWAVGALLMTTSSYSRLLIGAAYAGLAMLLLASVLRGRGFGSAPCALEGAASTLGRPGPSLGRWPALLPLGMGFLAGLKICPLLLLAFADAASTGTLLGSLILFLAFFVGTSIYFVPLSLLGAFRRFADLRVVGQFAAVIVALYYLVAGILMLAGGV